MFFFLQAEDGIRDYDVTGVQTCALPIFVDPNPAPKTPYYYFITTHNGACEGATTVGEFGISTPEATAVQAVSANNVSCDVIELDWTAETWAAPYTVWRDTTNVFDTLVNDELGTVTIAFFTDNTVDANTQYYYWVDRKSVV